MMIESFASFLHSSVLLKLFCLSFLIIILCSNGKKKNRSDLPYLLPLVAVLAIRDIAYYLLPSAAIQIVSDSLVLVLYGMWGARTLGKPVRKYLYIAANLLFALFVVFGSALVPGFSDRWAQALLAVDLVVLLAAFLTPAEPESSVPRAVRWPLAILFGTSLLGEAAFGYESPVVQFFLIEIAYLVPAVISFVSRSKAEDSERRNLAFAAESIDPLYGFLTRAGEVFKKNLKIEDLLDAITEAAIDETGADGGMALLVDDFEDVLTVKSFIGKFPPVFALPADLPLKPARIEAYCRHARIAIGETIFGEVSSNGKPVFIPDVASDPRIVRNGEEEFLSLNSLIVVPLMAGDKVFGVLALNKKEFGERFTGRDFERIELFARFGSLIVNELISVMENSELTDIEREAAIAADIQKTLLPKRLPELPNASFGAFSVPTRGVCGDYYDIIPFRHNRICLVIGDVAGKGIPSSIVMVMIRSILHLITSAQKDIATIINWVNRGITGRIDLDHFATLSLIFYDTESGTLEYTNAGHSPLMIYRKETGTVSTIELKGVPIGVERTTQYERVSLAVAKDDIVILYTDGVVEAMNREGRQYGAASLARTIEKNADLTAKEIANKVKMDIQDFMGSARQHDDQTLLLMKVKL